MNGLMGMLRRQDERVLHFVVTRRVRLLDRVMRAITHLADPAPAVATALLLAVTPQTALQGKHGLFALVLSHLLVQLLKRTCCRPRPVLPVGINSLIHAPDRFSFPSGHSAAGMSIALAMTAVATPPFAVVIVFLAVLVGLSRSYLGVHYPGDVLAGWLLANIAYLAGSWLFS